MASAAAANGNTSSFDYTAEGFLASRTVPDIGGATRTWDYGYTELGWLRIEVDAIGRATEFAQNINGQVVSITDPFGRVFNKIYDANGNLTHDFDAKGQPTQHAYDNADQKTQTTTRDGKVWQSFYTARGELESTRDPSLPAGSPAARTMSYLYDDAGRRIRETDANGFFATSTYDANGNRRFTTDKESKVWEMQYDVLNRVIADKDPLGDTTTTAFDAAGRVLTVTSPRGFLSSHEYDGRSRLKKWTDPEGNSWLYTYDANGNITNIEDALHGHYVMQYGPRNERLREENQDHYVWLYTYDALLRLRTQTDPLPLAGDAPETPVMRTFTYDLASRVEEVTFSTGRRTVFHYDLNNNPDEIRRVIPAQPTTTLTLTYDAMDRVTSSLDAFGKTVGYTFDPAGRVKTIVYPGAKTLTHGYDPAGRLTTLTDWAARASAFTYDNAGRLKTHAYPNGVLDTISYHDDGTVKKLDFTRAGGGAFSAFALEYAYDRNGNKTQEKKKGVLDWQPTIVPGGTVAPFDEAFTFKNNPGSGRLATSADALNPARNFTYTYNAAGDMTLAASPGQNTAFTYDEDHRVLNVTSRSIGIPPVADAVTTIANRYDALGRRIARTFTPPGSTATETRYVLDLTGSMERILCDTTAAGAVTARYIHGPDGLGYREDASGAITCFHADAMGNIIRTTGDASSPGGVGSTLSQYAYSPYGRLLATTGAAGNPYRFVGAQGVMEELPNLYFMRARYYSAEAGVFLSTDPVKNIGSDWKPEAYTYANTNPLSEYDPDGLMSEQAAVRYQQAAIQASLAAQEAAFAQAEVEIWEGINDATQTLWSAVTGDVAGVATGLTRQVGGLLHVLGQGKLGKGLRQGADIADAALIVKDATDVARNSGQVKRRVGELIDKTSNDGGKFLNNLIKRETKLGGSKTIYGSAIVTAVKSGKGAIEIAGERIAGGGTQGKKQRLTPCSRRRFGKSNPRFAKSRRQSTS